MVHLCFKKYLMHTIVFIKVIWVIFFFLNQHHTRFLCLKEEGFAQMKSQLNLYRPLLV